MQYFDYRQCVLRAFVFAHNLKQWGCKPTVYYGLFTPQKPRSSWDDRWQRSEESAFIHTWVGVENTFVDVSARQFGEKGLLITLQNDQRYQLIGYLDLYSCERIPLNTDVIQWESFYLDEHGTPRMRVLEVS